MPRIIPKLYAFDSSTNTIYPASEYTKKAESESETKFKIPKYFLQSILDMDNLNYYSEEDYLIRNNDDFHETFDEDSFNYFNELNYEYSESESDDENEYNTYQYN